MDRFIQVVAPVDAEGVQEDKREGAGPAPVNSPLTLYATLLSQGKALTQAMKGKKGYIHVVQTGGYNTGPATGALHRRRPSEGGERWRQDGRDPVIRSRVICTFYQS